MPVPLIIELPVTILAVDNENNQFTCQSPNVPQSEIFINFANTVLFYFETFQLKCFKVLHSWAIEESASGSQKNFLWLFVFRILNY